MYKVFIYGFDDIYTQYMNQVMFEIYKGNIEVLGVSGGGKKRKSVDDFTVYEQRDILEQNFDYLLIFNGAFGKIKQSFISQGLPKEKIIDGRVMSTPGFDFNRYVALIENPITIFSDDCWGGVVSHYLGLEFNSPFVNLHLSKGDYLKFLKAPRYYLESELKCEREGDLYKCQCPYGYLGEGEKKIILAFNHHICFKDAQDDWNRRKIRVNWSNIFVKMVSDDANLNIVEKFEALEYSKKILFTPANLTGYESTVFLPRYIELCERDAIHQGSNTFSAYIRKPNEIVKSIDLLKLLNGCSDYLRENI